MSVSKSARGPFDRIYTAPGLVAFACEGLSVTAQVFLRHRFAAGYLGLRAVAGMAAILTSGLLIAPNAVLEVAWLLGLYVALAAYHALTALRRAREGAPPQASLDGRPWLLRPLPMLGEAGIKREVEPALLFLAGLLLSGVTCFTGEYLMFAAVGMAVTSGLRQAARPQEAAAPAAPQGSEAAEGFRRGFE